MTQVHPGVHHRVGHRSSLRLFHISRAMVRGEILLALDVEGRAIFSLSVILLGPLPRDTSGGIIFHQCGQPSHIRKKYP